MVFRLCTGFSFYVKVILDVLLVEVVIAKRTSLLFNTKLSCSSCWGEKLDESMLLGGSNGSSRYILEHNNPEEFLELPIFSTFC